MNAFFSAIADLEFVVIPIISFSIMPAPTDAVLYFRIETVGFNN